MMSTRVCMIDNPQSEVQTGVTTRLPVPFFVPHFAIVGNTAFHVRVVCDFYGHFSSLFRSLYVCHSLFLYFLCNLTLLRCFVYRAAAFLINDVDFLSTGRAEVQDNGDGVDIAPGYCWFILTI